MIRVFDPNVPNSVRKAFRSNIPAGYVRLKDGEEPAYAEGVATKPARKKTARKKTAKKAATKKTAAEPAAGKAQEPKPAEPTADATDPSKE